MSGRSNPHAWLELIDSAEGVEKLQQQLVDAGYDIEIDGILGRKTEYALAAYQQQLAEQPLPPKPWYRSKGMRGILITAIGLVAVIFPDLEELADSKEELVDLILLSAEHGEELVGALIALWGLTSAFFGRKNATQSIDNTVIPGVRIPNRVQYAEPTAVELPSHPSQASRGDRLDKPRDNGYLGNFGDY